MKIETLYLKEQVSTALERLREQVVEWGTWAERPLTAESYHQIITTMELGKKAIEEIRERAKQEAEGFDGGFSIISLWVFFNVLTWFITHRAVSLNHRVETERRLRAAVERLRRS